MREAVIHLTRRQLAAIGLERVHAVASTAGLEQLTQLPCDGVGRIFQIHVRESIPPSTLERIDDVVWWERLRESSTGVTYLLKIDPPDETVRAAVTPHEATAGGVDDHEPRAELSVVGTDEDVGDSVERLGGPDVLVERLCEYPAPTAPMDALTNRQREVVRTAHRMGYYDVPRTATSDVVAEAVGLDPSTVVEHLQRAERNLMDQLVR